MKYIFTVFIISLLPTIFSCEQPSPPIKLNNEDYRMVDSLVKVEKKMSKSVIDSLCHYYNNSFYHKAIDSITTHRRAYIKKTLE